MTDNSPLLVAGLSLMVMLKLKVSEATFHWTPSTLSIIGRLKSRFLTTVARSASGIDSTTFREFDSHFVRQNPPLRRSSVRLSTRKIALYLTPQTSDSHQRRCYDSQCIQFWDQSMFCYPWLSSSKQNWHSSERKLHQIDVLPPSAFLVKQPPVENELVPPPGN